IKSVEEIVSRSGVSYETTVLNGEPRHMLVDYANRNEVDLVVIGSRGLNVLQEMVLGSVSHKVAKRANCPVLIVKEERKYYNTLHQWEKHGDLAARDRQSVGEGEGS